MLRRPPSSNRSDPLFPYPTLFLSVAAEIWPAAAQLLARVLLVRQCKMRIVELEDLARVAQFLEAQRAHVRCVRIKVIDAMHELGAERIRVARHGDARRGTDVMPGQRMNVRCRCELAVTVDRKSKRLNSS